MLGIVVGLWASSALAAAKPLPKGINIQEAQGIRTTFFSSVSDAPFCRLRIEGVQPAGARVGPFKIASPGVELMHPELMFFNTLLTREDWQNLVDHLLQFQRAPLVKPLELTLPDGRVFEVSRMPVSKNGQLRFLRAKLVGGSGAERVEVVIEPDSRGGLKVIPPAPAPTMSPTAPASEDAPVENTPQAPETKADSDQT